MQIRKQIMKIPALLLASLITVSTAAQSTKPVTKTSKKVTKKVTKTTVDPSTKSQPIAKKDTVKRRDVCVACGMG